MKRTSSKYHFSKVTILISCLFSLPAFAKSNNLQSLKNSSTTPSTLSRIGAWTYQLLTFNADAYLRIVDIKAFPTKNEALITWAASDLATGIIYFDTVSPVMISSSTPRVTASLYGNYAQSKANIRNLTASTTLHEYLRQVLHLLQTIFVMC